jgi:hypothetical protein
LENTSGQSKPINGCSQHESAASQGGGLRYRASIVAN